MKFKSKKMQWVAVVLLVCLGVSIKGVWDCLIWAAEVSKSSDILKAQEQNSVAASMRAEIVVQDSLTLREIISASLFKARKIGLDSTEIEFLNPVGHHFGAETVQKALQELSEKGYSVSRLQGDEVHGFVVDVAWN